MIPLINGLFAQFLRYAQKIILGISMICLRLLFPYASPGKIFYETVKVRIIFLRICHEISVAARRPDLGQV